MKRTFITQLFSLLLTAGVFLSMTQVAYAQVGHAPPCTTDEVATQTTNGIECLPPGSVTSGTGTYKGGITNPAISVKLGGSASEAASGRTFSSYFVTIWNAIIMVGVLAMLFSFVNGAIEWITAGGEQSKVQHARQRMTEGVIGLIILAGSFAIVGFLGTLFGFDLLKFNIPKP
jgi:hypothetical protein